MKSNWGIMVMMSAILILTPPMKPLIHQPSPLFQTTRTITQTNCGSVFDQFTQNEDWFEQLVNPTLNSPDEVSARLDLYSKVYDCIGNDTASLSDELLSIRTLIEYFLIFAGGEQSPGNETSLVITSFEQSDDPAIVKVRDEAGISPPKGYIFVRFYSSRDVMPDLVKPSFESKDVAGVTILMRYIAVLNEKKETWPQQAMQFQTLPETISHELVHAYINSLLGLKGLDLPKWYEEGLAIYFSGSGKGHSIVTPDLVVSTTPPEEYQQYDTEFKYLETKLGRKRLLECIKQSIAQADPSKIYQDLGIANDQVLASRASSWSEQWLLIRAAAILLVAILSFWGFSKLTPEVRCQHCQYGGKKKEFVDGICPSCHCRYDRRY
jgi:hypothetical protein